MVKVSIKSDTDLKNKMPKSSANNQFLASITCNLLAISFGTTCGWSGPNFITLTSDESPLESGPLTVSQASMVVSLRCAGGILGSVLYSYLLDRLSRKMLMITLAVPQIISWVLIYVANSVYYLYASRFIAGAIGGGVFTVIPVYVSEIADDSLRGALGSMMTLALNVGILMAYIVAHFASYYDQIRILIFIPIIFLLIFNYFPETPEYLQKQNHILLAQRSREFYSGKIISTAVKPVENETVIEAAKVEKNYEMIESAELTFSDFCTPAAKKAMLIIICVTIVSQFCGVTAMLNYTNKIFQEAGSNLSPNGASIIVAAVQLFANVLTMILVDRAGRKILYTVSSVGTAAGLVCMGLHDLYKVELAAYNWLPIVSFSLIILSASIGILPLMIVILMEVLPKKIKRLMTMVAMLMNWVLVFILVSYYPLMTQEFGMHNCMFVFAACCVTGLIFTLVVLPETKGKSHDAIMKALE